MFDYGKPYKKMLNLLPILMKVQMMKKDDELYIEDGEVYHTASKEGG